MNEWQNECLGVLRHVVENFHVSNEQVYCTWGKKTRTCVFDLACGSQNRCTTWGKPLKYRHYTEGVSYTFRSCFISLLWNWIWKCTVQVRLLLEPCSLIFLSQFPSRLLILLMHVVTLVWSTPVSGFCFVQVRLSPSSDIIMSSGYRTGLSFQTRGGTLRTCICLYIYMVKPSATPV